MMITRKHARRRKFLSMAVGTFGLATSLSAANTYQVAPSIAFRLEVNTTTGDVGILNIATTSSAITLYQISDGSKKKRSADW
jgi:hypothetical protein